MYNEKVNRLKKRKGKENGGIETADRKNGRSPGASDEWWERLMMEPARENHPRYGCGTGDSIRAVAGRRCQGSGKKGHPAEPEDPVRRRTKRRCVGLSLGGVPRNIPHRPED